jgi:hypothetical protein
VNPPCRRAARGAISFPRHLPHVRAGKPIGPPCFSPHTNHGERFLGTKPRFMLSTVAPGQTTGVLRIASSVLHILPQTASRPSSIAIAALVIGRKAAQERFSEENFRNLATTYSTSPETHFSTALPQAFAELCENSWHTASLDELAEPNNYSNCNETSSTHLFASQCQAGAIWLGRVAGSAFQGMAASGFRETRVLCLLNRAAASTLNVFHSI